MKYSCVQLYVLYTNNSLLLNQHNGDDTPQKKENVQELPPTLQVSTKIKHKNTVQRTGT